MHPHALTLLRLLADGQFHSGAALAAHLGLSRTTIWQRMSELQALGLPIDCVRGRGYHLACQLELLDIEALRADLADTHWQLRYEPIVTSTMDGWDKQTLLHAQVYLAELQLQGRGRQGRRWMSPFASSLTFSLVWQFNHSMTQLAGLSLAVGVMVRRACQQPAIQLKWPNDLWVDGKKLGGILIELRGEMQGPCTAIIGIGLNVAINPKDADTINRAWCDLVSLAPNGSIARHALLAAILRELQSGLTEFGQNGFAGFQQEWQQADALADRFVTLVCHDGEQSGWVRGVDATGQLILEQDGVIRLFASGEIMHVQNIHEFAQ